LLLVVNYPILTIPEGGANLVMKLECTHLMTTIGW